MLKVEVVFVAADKTIFHRELQVSHGVSVGEVLSLSGLYEAHPESGDMSVGIYSKRVNADDILKDGDRIEVYRSLQHDPKDKRRLKASIKDRRKS